VTNGYSKPCSKKFNFEIKITSNDWLKDLETIILWYLLVLLI
jgi:hypothetical protein